MTDYGISATVFSNLILMNTQYVTSIYGSLMESYGVFFRAFFTLYTVFIGYKWYKAESKASAYDLIVTWALVAIIYSSVMEWNWYYDTVIETVVGITLKLSSFFISAASHAIGNDGYGNIHEVFKALDQTLFNFFGAIQDFSPKGNFLVGAWRYFNFILAMSPLVLVFIAMYIAFFVIYAMAFFSMFIFFVMGGICFLFAAFRETRQIFFTWCRGLLNYMLIAIVASIVMGVCSKGINEAVSAFIMQSQTVSVVVSDSYLKILIWCAFCLAMIFKTPDFAAHISGATSGSTTGIAGAITAGTSAMGTGVFVGSKMAGGAAWKQARQVGNEVVSGGKNALEQLKEQRGAK